MQKNEFKERQQELIRKINDENGIILLLSDFEQQRYNFSQNSSFFYMTGLKEPATAVIFDIKANKSILFIPHYNSRDQWMENTDQKIREIYDETQMLGQSCSGYMCHPYFSAEQYEHLISYIRLNVDQGKKIFTLYPHDTSRLIQQRFVLDRLGTFIPGLAQAVQDISPLIDAMRRIKSKAELAALYCAIEITADAHLAAAETIVPGRNEQEVQAVIEYIFTAQGAQRAFPSIVASSANATILHYSSNNRTIQQGELVVVDIGAEYQHYCADITRTYPSSGKYTDEQRELYLRVLETQEYIASFAKPGYWIIQADNPQKSLHHLAKEFLAQYDLDRYFVHNIGHFLGLDVHDVGNYQEPLQAGDVITIEPGIYIPEKNIGIRIEDNYWIVEDGSISLSDDLVKHPDEIEILMKDRTE